MLLFIPCLLAGEIAALPGLDPLQPAPGARGERVVGWDQVGLAPAGPESAAFGPGRLAIGPDGAWAVWDVVNHRVIGSFGEWGAAGVDGLAFAPDGDLLVLQGRALLRVDGAQVASVAVPGLVPPGAELEVWGGVAMGVDALGNGHPVAMVDAGGLGPASGPSLVAPDPTVIVRGGDVLLDGAVVARGALAARRVGDCAVVERGARGAVTGRALVCPGGRWELPVDGLYRPVGWIAADGLGGHAWLDPRADGLHLVRVSR